ncbi:MAG: EMC3/TMCO1 family protein [Candidatus Micrarchaeia archaeon]
MFDPQMVTIIICILAGAYALVFRYIVYEIGGMKLVMEKNKEMQEEMRAIQKKYFDAAKAHRDKELKEYESKMNQMAMDMLKMQLKPMLFTLPLLLVTSLIASQLYVHFFDYIIHTPIALPIPFNHGELINWRTSFGPVAWFWISFMLVSLVAQVKLGGKTNGKTKRQG